jgi:hypothetical protein
MVTEPVTDGKAFGVRVSLGEGDKPPSRRERRGEIAREGSRFTARTIQAHLWSRAVLRTEP